MHRHHNIDFYIKNKVNDDLFVLDGRLRIQVGFFQDSEPDPDLGQYHLDP